MSTIYDADATNKIVVTYLKKMRLQNQAYYDKLILYGAKPHDIIKIIERPDECGTWPFDYVCQIFDAVKKTAKNYVIDFPEIEQQTDEDTVLSKLLRKNNDFAFGTNKFFGELITVKHVIAFMERNEVIYAWNGDFILRTQAEVKRVKEFLL